MGTDVETLEYVTRARHLWWIVLVPLLAAAAGGAWVLQQPPTWTGTATVQPVVTGASPSQSSGGVNPDDYVSAFQAIATGAPMLDRVADQTGVQAGRLARDLEVSRAGDSTGLVVRFAGTDRDDVEPVLRAVTASTLEQVFQGEVAQAESAVARAQEQVAAADAALTEFGTRAGVADPGRAYQALLSQVNTLDARRVEAVAAGDATRVAEIAAELERVRQALPGYVPLLTEFDQLSADRSAAQDRLDRARDRQDAATGQVAAADPDQVVFVEGPVEQSQLMTVARTAAVAAAVALVLCLLLASVLAQATRSRTAAGRAGRPRRGEETSAADQPVDGTRTRPSTTPASRPTWRPPAGDRRPRPDRSPVRRGAGRAAGLRRRLPALRHHPGAAPARLALADQLRARDPLPRVDLRRVVHEDWERAGAVRVQPRGVARADRGHVRRGARRLRRPPRQGPLGRQDAAVRPPARLRARRSSPTRRSCTCCATAATWS